MDVSLILIFGLLVFRCVVTQLLAPGTTDHTQNLFLFICVSSLHMLFRSPLSASSFARATRYFLLSSLINAVATSVRHLPIFSSSGGGGSKIDPDCCIEVQAGLIVPS